jgi:uncharacterized membrane protein
MSVHTDLPAAPVQPTAPGRLDGLATASLVCGIASFVPLAPPLITPLAAILLGLLSKPERRDNGVSGRSSRAVTGVVLGCVSLLIAATIAVVYSGVLGYPLPGLHRYHPGQ